MNSKHKLHKNKHTKSQKGGILDLREIKDSINSVEELPKKITDKTSILDDLLGNVNLIHTKFKEINSEEIRAINKQLNELGKKLNEKMKEIDKLYEPTLPVFDTSKKTLNDISQYFSFLIRPEAIANMPTFSDTSQQFKTNFSSINEQLTTIRKNIHDVKTQINSFLSKKLITFNNNEEPTYKNRDLVETGNGIANELERKDNKVSREINEQVPKLEQLNTQLSRFINILHGGVEESEVVIELSNDILSLLMNFEQSQIDLLEIRKLITQYNKQVNDIQHFTDYIIAIINDENPPAYYNYLTLERINHYLDIINKINYSNQKSDGNMLYLYFQIYHQINLVSVNEFLTYLRTKLIQYISVHNNEKYVIDVKNSPTELQSSFIIFNHFKEILDNYDKTIINQPHQ
jgi:ABC-type transporter Mla subunit MlaD